MMRGGVKNFLAKHHFPFPESITTIDSDTSHSEALQTFFLTSNLRQAMSGVMQRGLQEGFLSFHLISFVVTSLPFCTYTLLSGCALITNYVYWMFLLVSSVHAMGC
jgi:hypothetical protein